METQRLASQLHFVSVGGNQECGGGGAPRVFQGRCNAAEVDTYFEKVLLPVPSPGSVIVLDNARFHQSLTTAALVAAAGCKLLFLPACSPDLNPINIFGLASRPASAKTPPMKLVGVGGICLVRMPLAIFQADSVILLLPFHAQNRPTGSHFPSLKTITWTRSIWIANRRNYFCSPIKEGEPVLQTKNQSAPVSEPRDCR